MTLVAGTGVGMGQSEGTSVGELTLPLFCPGVAQVENRSPDIPLYLWESEKWPKES